MRRLLDRLDMRYVKVCLYASVTVLLTIVAAMVLYFSSGFFAKLWMLICAVLEPAVFGCLIGYLLNPVVERVSHALKAAGWHVDDFKARRVVGVVVAVLGIVVLLCGILVLMAVLISRSLYVVNVDSLQKTMSEVGVQFSGLFDLIQRRLSDAGLASGSPTSETATDLGATIMGAFHSMADVASTALFSTIFAIYMLIDGNRVGGYALRVAHATIGEALTERLRDLLHDADRVFSGYLRGQFIDAFVVGVLASVSLTVAGVPYGIVIGVLCGLGNLIPYVGAPLGIVTTIMVCVADGRLDKIIVGIALLALIMFVDSNVINPRLLSENVEVHPLLVVAALIAGSAVGGLAGMLVAVPTAAFLKIQLDRWLEKREAADDDPGHSPAPPQE